MLYYRCNNSFGDMLHWTHETDGTRNMVQVTTMVILSTLDEFTLVDDGMKGSGIFQCLRICVRLIVFYACS